MYASRKGPPPASCPSDAQAREKLALYVYEYLHHIGAKQAAETFLKEIRWDKNITLGEPPGFLHSWWCVFWDLYCAAPERRDTCEHSQEAKAFHDYGFVNSGFPPHQVNGIHGPNATPSPIGMPSSGPDGLPPGAGHPGMPGPSGPPFFTTPGGVPIRPSPPQQTVGVSQASPHHSGPSGMPCISQSGFPPGPVAQRYAAVPRGAGVPGQRMPQDNGPMVAFPGGPHAAMFPPADQMRPSHMLQLQRLPPSGAHPRMHAQMNPNVNNFGAMRPPGPPPVSAGLRHPSNWPPSTSSAPIMSNGPVPGPGTPGILPSPQNMPPSDMNAGDRIMVGPMGQSLQFPPMTSESSMIVPPGPEAMMMNGDGLDIKNSPSSSQGLNGGTPGPAGTGPGGGPGSVPPVSSGQPGSAESMEFSSAGPFPGQDLEQNEIAKIKASMMEESKQFESKDGVTTVVPRSADGDDYSF